MTGSIGDPRPVDSATPPLDALTAALRTLSEPDQIAVVAALGYASSASNPWRDRYTAADRALRALGAVRFPKGQRKTASLWTMPCGCRYTLYYASPSSVTRCPAHPGAPIRLYLRDAVGLAKGCAMALAGMLLVTAIMLYGVALLEVVTGSLPPEQQTWALGYLIAGAVVGAGFWVHRRTKTSIR